jgi:acetyl-CoA carboxylase biotin carboxyl carrier protein
LTSAVSATTLKLESLSNNARSPFPIRWKVKIPMPDLTFAEVGQILRLLESIDASEVNLEWGDLKLQVRHGGPAVGGGESNESGTDALQAGTEPRSPVTSHSEAPVVAEPVQEPIAGVGGASDVPDHWVAISAPMVGTFYRSPKPGEPAYVEAGDVVAPGDPVGLVEVMKLFTELKSEVAGKVARIDADNSALVEFGQPLIWIEPA